MDFKKEDVVLIVILMIALGIRLCPIAANLPYMFWHDENNYIESALRLAGGHFMPLSFSHGSLYQLILFIEYAVYFIITKLAGLTHSPTEFYALYLGDPSPFFLIARATSVFAGTAIAYLSYLIARRAYNRRVGLIACLFTAVSFIMMQMSSLALADMSAVLILLLSFLLFMHSAQSPRGDRLYYGACALLGLAIACKYHTVFGIGALLITAFIKARASVKANMLTARLITFGLMAVIAGFFAGMPFPLFNPAAFYNDTIVKMGGEYILRNPNHATWSFYFTNHLRNGLGLLLEIVVLSGMVYAIYKHSKSDILLLSFPVLFYAVFMNSAGYAYHMLPAIPFIIILGARFLEWLVRTIYPKASLSALLLLGIIIVLPTGYDSVRFVKILSSMDTRIEAKAWIEANVPENSTILSEGYASSVAIHGPPLFGNMQTLDRDLADSLSSGGSGLSTKIKMTNFNKISAAHKLYDIYKTVALSEEDVGRYNPGYLIVTSDNDFFSGAELDYYIKKEYLINRQRLKEKISERYELINSFTPTDTFTWWFPHLTDYDYKIIRSTTFGKLKSYVRGPRIDIFKLRE